MENSCQSCQKPKATLNCGICECSLCKYCAVFLDEGHFNFLPKIPKDLSHTTYCHSCYEAKVAPAVAKYDEDMEKAKHIIVFYSKQGKETRMFSRKELPFHVTECWDYDETLMRLAFLAVQAGYNAIIDVDLVSEKVRINNRQSLKWRGSAVPTNVDESKLPRDRSLWQNPN
jgi:hypothetical protein